VLKLKPNIHLDGNGGPNLVLQDDLLISGQQLIINGQGVSMRKSSSEMMEDMHKNAAIFSNFSMAPFV